MKIILDKEKLNSSYVQAIKEMSMQKVMSCYQCGKCTAGCPIADFMDVVPNEMMRLVMLGEIEKLISSKAIWLCTSCFQCGTRCPKGIEVHRVFEALRSIALREGKNYTNIEKLSEEQLEAIPQQGIIAGFRKFESLE
ncbi:MAG: 4Fe-4S dicluster domain-containing protein [Proteobacteria bacterium]|nr:4Fe-4S dicluster domain-containing protein [Pseudomonadota bacterium]